MIHNIVLSGGSIKGYSYLSLLRIIHEHPEMFKLRKLIGSSIGAIFALIINLGLDYDIIKEKLIHKNLSELRNINLNNILQFANKYGIDDGTPIMQYVSEFVVEKYNKTSITFKELYDLTNIDLIITGTCLNTSKTTYFSHLTYPDMMVLSAIRISISIPYYFIPVSYNDCLYVDGAVTDNFPIQLCKDELDDTLGIYLLDTSEVSTEINGWEDYISKIFYTSTGNRDLNKLNHHKPYCAVISFSEHISLLKNYTEFQKMEWLDSSYKVLMDALTNRPKKEEIDEDNNKTKDLEEKLMEHMKMFFKNYNIENNN